MKEEKAYLADLTDKIAILLDGVWATDQERLESGYPGRFLNGPEDKILHFTTPYNNTARVEINGIFHHDLSQHLPYNMNREKTEITVARSKTPEQIARDIERRLMPPYERVLAQTKDRKAKADAYEAKKMRAIDAIRDAMGSGASIKDGDVIRYNPFCRARYYGGDIKIEVELPVDKAVEILRQI